MDLTKVRKKGRSEKIRRDWLLLLYSYKSNIGVRNRRA